MKISTLKPFGLLIETDSRESLQDIPFASLQKKLQEHALVVIRGMATPDRDEFLSYCRNAHGFQTLNWSFGPVMEMREIPDAPNYLFSREAVPFHWDGAFHQVPDYLVFSCVEAPSEGAGGETLFAHTGQIFAEASGDERGLWSQARLKYETEKLAHYGGSIEGSLVQKHPLLGTPILRFAEEVKTRLNPVHLEIQGVSSEIGSRIVSDLTQKIYAEPFRYRHAWQPGDLLLADNHSLIHGRTAFKKEEPRHLRRIQLVRSSHA